MKKHRDRFNNAVERNAENRVPHGGVSSGGIVINKHQLSGVNSKTIINVIAIILTVSLFAIPGHALDTADTSKRLVLFQGSILQAYFNNKYVEVKRLSPGGYFYGYGWLDEHTVFIAFQPEGNAEAIADFEVVDLSKGRTTKLDGIGGMGESNFDVNPTTGEIVFNDGDDLKLLKLNPKRDAYRIQEIKKSASCWAVFWIDSKTVGCRDSQKDILVKYSIPLK